MANARVTGIAVDCPDPKALCTFYSALLGIEPAGDDAVVIAKGDQGNLELWFQPVENYMPPTWPTQERGQQLHMDLEVDDREAMVVRAIELGARQVDVAEHFTVMLDPAGHPFCLCDPQ
ncbi:MAG: VOC family protein [Thermomicrobiales bacterium]